ncbi:MAG: leucine--tRNA ligase [Candidatus Rokubacteria bacterium]|nr:leucine--tRNA ligase [Candidatus Rokubacteria bacterium]
MSSDRYPFREIEAKWQGIWEARNQFRVTEDPSKPKFYCLEMFPYPSGRIHMGHVRVYAIGDVLARYKRMRGFNVLHPMGWDAFGLPAENAAIEHGVHPAIWTYENIDHMRAQLKKMGLSYDWDREVATCDPAYYKWEQLVFIKMLERGLAYRKRSRVNWCPSCQTVLANEQVEAGRCWRCDTEVTQKDVDGWFFKITKYADELLEWCERLPGWPERVMTMQRNWIGRSEGAEFDLPVAGRAGLAARVFTFIADYVLMGYGTGAIMAVPGEDQRDWDFAAQHGLPIIETVARPAGFTGQAYTGDGVKINSGFLDGLTVAEATRKAIDWLVARGLGEARVNYRLRDWGISRQRYWGAPIPVVYCDRHGMVPEKEENLPVVLPRDVQISGKGSSPLAEVASFVNAKCPVCGGPARRDTDTMDTFVESSWYFLRYCSPRYDQGMFERQAAEYWMPVDQYIGGIEHAVLHLLYARFYTKVLRDLGLVKVDEPFLGLLSQGMVIKDGAKMSKSKGNVVDPDDLIRSLGADTARLFSLFAAPPERDLDWNDHGVEGASRFLNRVWRFVIGHAEELRTAPRRAAGPLSEAGRAFRRTIHETIARVTTDIENEFHFNTAISAIMEMVNALHAFDAAAAAPREERLALTREAVETLLLLVGPFCPHIAEELWSALGHAESVFAQRWPEEEPAALARDEVTVVVQVDGKVRSRLTVEVGAPDERVRERALADDKVRPWLAGRRVARVVVIPGRLVNVVTRAD